MALTDKGIASLKPKAKGYKTYDGNGLYVHCSPTGAKSFRWDFSHADSRKTLTIGAYPTVSLKDARLGIAKAKEKIAAGVDPSLEKRLFKNKNQDALETFEDVAKAWLKIQTKWKDSHRITVIRRLDLYVFPYLRSQQIASIQTPYIYQILKNLDDRGTHETAKRVCQIIQCVFNHARLLGLCMNNPADGLTKALTVPKVRHFSAITKPDQVGDFLKTVSAYRGSLVVETALKLTPLVFLRPCNLRLAEWAEIDLEKGEWSIPGAKMKMGLPLIVPLARQAVELLSNLKKVTGSSKWVFPSPRSSQRPLSNNAVLGAMRRMGIEKDETCVHGFRATARTILHEVMGFPSEVIESQLAHKVADPNGRAYNRTQFLPQRRDMMQAWADFLDNLSKRAT